MEKARCELRSHCEARRGGGGFLEVPTEGVKEAIEGGAWQLDWVRESKRTEAEREIEKEGEEGRREGRGLRDGNRWAEWRWCGRGGSAQDSGELLRGDGELGDYGISCCQEHHCDAHSPQY